MKQWLSTFTAAMLAVLISGALLLTWQRRVSHWESVAASLTTNANECIYQFRSAKNENESLWRVRIVKSQLAQVRFHVGKAPMGAQSDFLRAARDQLDRTVGEYLAEFPTADLDAVK
jgi:hypothetical protein